MYLVADRFELESLPLGEDLRPGYDHYLPSIVTMIKRRGKRCGKWSGIIVADRIITSNYFGGDDFEIMFHDGSVGTGFVIKNHDNIFEVAYQPTHKNNGTYALNRTLVQGEPLFIIGSIFGIPDSMALVRYLGYIKTDKISEQRLDRSEPHAMGAPVFTCNGGEFVGLITAHITETDSVVINPLKFT